MAFGSPTYFLLLAVTVLALYFSSAALRRWVLLGASLAFFCLWSVPLLIVPLWCALSGFFFGRALGRTGGSGNRLLAVSVVTTLLPLLGFKYLWALALAFPSGLLHESTMFQTIILPLGISFYTFQVVGYLVDVARHEQEACDKFSQFLVYVMFFPNLVAGPIERASNLLDQFERPRHRLDPSIVRSAVWLIGIGLFKKRALADSLAPIVDSVFHDPFAYSGGEVVLTIVLARYQFFCDFSGYTDIARGSARLLGVELSENFRRPFLAASIGDFWRRWHISLTSWMREYLYYPLVAVMAGRMWWLGRFGIYLPVLATFLVLGVWHGPTANYAIYGLLQGIMIAFFDSTRDIRDRALGAVGIASRPRLRHVLAVGFTFTVCVCPPIVFFWLTDLGAALDVFRAVAHTGGEWLSIATLAVSAEGRLLHLVLALVVLQSLQIVQEKRDAWGWLERQPWYVRGAIYWATLAAFMFLVAGGEAQPFKYGRF